MARQATLARFEVSGEILSEDTVALLAAPDCKLAGAEIDGGDFAAAWDLLSEQWQSLRQEIGEFDTERLRRRWIMPLLELLGHQPQYLRSHPTYAQNRTIPLTHRSGSLPIWLLEYAASPDSKEVTGRRRISPHELFQEYLDLSDDDWGLICNGKSIRLLHDYHKTLTRNYVEADLESIFEALDVDAFRAVWRIFRASSFQPGAKGVLPIEKLRDHSRQEGAEIGKELRKQVLEAIKTLGNGFLAADRSGELRQALQDDPAAAGGFYHALLRLVYRLLFLLYIENKPGWTPATNPVWASSYSISRLREQAEELTSTRADAEDHWEGLRIVFGMIRNGCAAFNILPYGGELFDDERLGLIRDAALRNSDLLQAIRLLTVFERNRQVYRVNFRTLRIDALGSVYEGLLDVDPILSPNGTFDFGPGTERKLTGSYYTPPELVAELIKSALVPVIEDRLQGKESQADQEKALLSIKVVDPACGSGAFLIQALDKLAERLCGIRKEGEEPSELDIREARRDVVTHCIHGVDLNPMAVELCKFTLWLHCAHPQLPLAFLDHNIRCGNSLVGGFPKAYGRADRLRDLPPDIPDEAFDPVTGDDKEAAKKIKARNRTERTGKGATSQGSMQPHGGELHVLKPPTAKEWDAYTEGMHALTDWPESDLASVEKKHQRFEELRAMPAYRHRKDALDFWTAAFFWPLKDANDWNPTTQAYRAFAEHGSAPRSAIEQARTLAQQNRFFHWGLEFAHVLSRGGFDCVLGNPPWETLQLEEQEFFATRAPDISRLSGVARKKAIDTLAVENPELHGELEAARHASSAQTKFCRESGRYPLTAVGKVNTYALFTETSWQLTHTTGSVGLVVPTGIATDDTLKRFFSALMSRGSLNQLVGYENEEFIFPGIANVVRFCCLTIMPHVRSSRVAFYLRRFDQLSQDQRYFEITSEDVKLVNPNSLTCPIFRTKADFSLNRKLYSTVPVLAEDGSPHQEWGVKYRQGLFNMASDASYFHDDRMPSDLPLYEAKLFWNFDHRFSSYEFEGHSSGRGLAEMPTECYQDPHYSIQPRYWVSSSEVDGRLRPHWERDWLIAFRDITSSKLLRTVVCSFLPRVGVGHTAPLLFLEPKFRNRFALCFVANLNSLVLDYAARQKVGGTHLTYGVLCQLPVLPPQDYESHEVEFITKRVLELVFVSWDMRPLARDTGYEGPPFTWDENHRALVSAELDAYFARLYGLTRKQLRYILDPHGLSDRELEDILDPWEDPTCSGPHLLPAEPTQDFPGETFRVLKNNDAAKYGEYRTRRLVLEAWARLEAELGPAPARPPLPRPHPVAAETRNPSGNADGKHTSAKDDELVLVPPGSRQQSLSFGTGDRNG